MNEPLDIRSVPLSPEQRALLPLVAAQASQGSAAVLLAAALEGPLDVARLRAAVAGTLGAHEVLRSPIRDVAGYRGPRQLCTEAMPPLDWQQADLCATGVPPTALADWLEDFGRAPLVHAQGRLVRVGLARTGEQRHTLALAASALVADRGSLHNLFDQLALAYAGEQAVAPEDLFPYARFAEWRQALAQDADAPSGRAYWDRYLSDAPAAPRLPLRQAGAPVPGAQRVRAAQPIDAGLAARIEALANAQGSSAERILQAVWWLLLARLNASGFIGGWQHDCRRDYALMRGAVGVFDKILPVRVEPVSDLPFAQWLDRLDRTADAHIEGQEYWPVDAPPTEAHRVAGFAFHEAPRRHGVELQWQLSALPGPASCFELALQAGWGAQGGELCVLADGARYSQAAVERLLMQLRTLLEAAIAQPAAPVSALSPVGPRECELLLAMNDTVADFGAVTLAGRIAHWAHTTPHAAALEAGGRRLSYLELDRRIDGLAHWLQARGVVPGALVALELPRSLELVLAIFACWRAGAAYVPLEPQWPEARREAVLADARPALVLRADAGRSASAWPEAAIADFDPAAFDDKAPAPASALHDLAYVLYTSGSTGRPKGVAIEQGQLLNYVAAASQAMDLARCRRWALSSSVVADLGNTALFCSFFHGACLVVADAHEVQDAEAFARFMARHEIDALKIVPSHLEALLECASPRLPGTLVLGGEPAPRTLVERIGRLAPQCRVFNHYGPTEATVGVMVHALGAAPAPEVLPLTRVLANNRVHVLDEALRLVPAGALGQLYIGGAQLCRGYHQREVDGAFVADPFRPGERLYRTGDLACVLPEGGLRLVGRADHQVKIHGFRVEPAEVEAVLLAQPGVRQAVVLAVPDAAGAMALTAFFVAEGVAAAALRERLATLLPAPMVPARFTAVADFARLPNGKIDRLALHAPGPAAAPSQAQVAPRDALEAVLAECMAMLLGRTALGIDEDFFELGGHSLLVIKLVARIRKQLGVEIAPGLVFDRPSVAALAEALRAASPDAAQLEQRAQAQRAGAQPESAHEMETVDA